MNVPKKQHYVPISYLNGFTNPEEDDLLWVYNKQGESPRCSIPKNEGYERYTYQVEHPDGSIDKSSLENSLADLDGEGVALIRRLNEDVCSLSDQDRFNLGFYVLKLTDSRMRDVHSRQRKRLHLTIELVAASACHRRSRMVAIGKIPRPCTRFFNPVRKAFTRRARDHFWMLVLAVTISHGSAIDRLARLLRGPAAAHRTHHGGPRGFLWRSDWDESWVLQQIALDA